MCQIYFSNIPFAQVATIYIKFIQCLSVSCIVYVMFVTKTSDLYISSKNQDNVT